MAKDTRVTFDNPSPVPIKHTSNGRLGSRQSCRAERQISYEETENCVNEMSESFPALSNKAHRLMRQVSESFNFRTIIVLLSISVIINLLLVISLGICFGFWISQKHDAVSLGAQSAPGSTSSLSQSSLNSGGGEAGPNMRLVNQQGRTILRVGSCMLCADIDKFGTEFQNRVKVRSNNNVCCTDEGKSFTDDYFLTAEHFHQKVSGSSGGVGRPCRKSSGRIGRGMQQASAHLMLDVKQTKLNMKQSSGKSHRTPMAWTTRGMEEGITFLGDGLYYDKGEITFHRGGWYYIYSHVTLSTNENPLSEHMQEKLIVHSVFKRTGKSDKPETLLFAQVTLRQNEVRSTNVEGAFEFKQGDVLSVYVSHPSYLKDKRPANIFGLFPVSSI